MKRPLRIDYLLEATSLCGGVKVVVEQASALSSRGIDARIDSLQPRPDWIRVSVPFRQVAAFRPDLYSASDFIVATSFSQVAELYPYQDLRPRLIHLFQGYEGDCREALGHEATIRHAYRLAVPRWTVSERLAAYARNLCGSASPVYCVGQAIDHSIFFPPPEGLSSRESRGVVLVGDLPNSVKAIRVGLEALAHVRERIDHAELIRIAPRDFRRDEESICAADEYHVGVEANAVADIMRRARLFLSTSTPAEGFGLPLLEALACGLPAVAIRIPSYDAFSPRGGFCRFVDRRDPRDLADAIVSLWDDTVAQERLAETGFRVAAAYTYEAVADRIVRWCTSNGRAGA